MNRIVAFDIGIHNLAWSYVQMSFPKEKSDSRVEENIRDQLNVKRMDLWDCFPSPDMSSIDIYLRLYEYLSQFHSIWKVTDTLLIEKQLVTKRHLNIQAFKISQHIMSYFLIHYSHQMNIMEYPAAFKSKLLFQESFTTGYQRKRWAVEKTKWFLEKDPVAYEWWQCYPKLDDISDTILMCIVYYYTHFMKIHLKDRPKKKAKHESIDT